MAKSKILKGFLKDFLNSIEKAFSKSKKYRCQICRKTVHQAHSLEHVKAEEYLLNLIRKDHPQWEQKELTCPECVEYYRKLMKQAEI